MGSRIPNLPQNDMIALWKAFVQQRFKSTRSKVSFNGKTRNVFSDGTQLYVLDEWHGDLEVLDLKGKHLGTIPIDAVKKGDGWDLKLGSLKTGGSKHTYKLT
jgi:hypothetical protein